MGSGTLPGNVAARGWHATGRLTIPKTAIAENGTSRFYTFGSQRLWSRHPGLDSSGVSGFFQFGTNDSRTLLSQQYFGAGLTDFGLVPGRPADIVGAGVASSWLNRNRGFRSNETLLAVYYQAKILDNVFLEPVLTYVPNPGASPSHKSVTAVTIQATVLF